MKLVKTGEIIHVFRVSDEVHLFVEEVFRERADVWDVVKAAGTLLFFLAIILVPWLFVIAPVWWLWPSVVSATLLIWQ